MPMESSVKKLVLEEQMGFLCEELGDPGRYFPYLRSRRMLDSSDCQSIKAQITFKDQVLKLIELLKSRETTKGEGAFDVLVDALKKQRVQAHIARSLQKALVKAKEDGGDGGIIANGIETRSNTIVPEEEVATEPALIPSQYDSEHYEMHPQVGALPPLPTDEPTAASNDPICDEHCETIHPRHGLFPSMDENGAYAQQQSGVTAESSYYDSGMNTSECELGGQSQHGSMLTSNYHADYSMSSGPISSGTTSSYEVRNDSVGVLKLEAAVRDLTLRLERAQAENRKKDAHIRTLQQLLASAGTPERELGTKGFGSHSFV